LFVTIYRYILYVSKGCILLNKNRQNYKKYYIGYTIIIEVLDQKYMQIFIYGV